MHKRTRGILLLAAGFVMLFAAVALYWTYDGRDRLAGETAAALLRELEADPAPSAAAEPEPTLTTPEGYQLLGSLHIPALDLSLPVLAAWDETLLDAAPCRYSGTLAADDLVIMGHSYRTHFRPLWSIQPGAAVLFTDALGRSRAYTVAQVETVPSTQGDALPSDYPLTLFTCTADSKHRLLVRCR